MKPKLWGGRFKKAAHPRFEKFSSSLPVDYKLAPYDLKASEVHCALLERSGLISRILSRKIAQALRAIERQLPRKTAVFAAGEFEDVHSWIEHELVRRVGQDAGMIHAGRSRNDQVNIATRLYCRHKLGRVIKGLLRVQAALVRTAGRYREVTVAGMTHLQKAQPVPAAHIFLSYAEALERSKDRLSEALGRSDLFTLGSGAFAGSLIRLDREWAAKKLGFTQVSRNSLDAVGSRDFAAEIVGALALLGSELSRISEDLLIGQMEPSGIYVIPEELCTGSSMMPHKRNPDFLELARGAASILIGNAAALLTLLKGTPGSYNRDLQWDKRPLFESFEIAGDLLELFEVLFRKLRIDRARAREALKDDRICATDVAEVLAASGVPFREAHVRVGRLVKWCEDRCLPLRETPEETAQKILGLSARKLACYCDPVRSVRLKRNFGSAGTGPAAGQLKFWERKLRALL